MTITEFARIHDVQVQTVAKYVREHDEFKGHITKKGNTRVLDNEAIQMLEKKYPLPKPVQVIDGIAPKLHYEALAEKDNQIQALQKIIIDLQSRQSQLLEEIGDLRGKTLLLEDRNRQIEELKTELQEERGKSIWERLFRK